jgi:hypothetical protein
MMNINLKDISDLAFIGFVFTDVFTHDEFRSVNYLKSIYPDLYDEIKLPIETSHYGTTKSFILKYYTGSTYSYDLKVILDIEIQLSDDENGEYILNKKFELLESNAYINFKASEGKYYSNRAYVFLSKEDLDLLSDNMKLNIDIKEHSQIRFKDK